MVKIWERKLMLSCKQVAKVLADHRYNDLPSLRRFFLKLHIATCFICGRYHREVLLIQDMVQTYLEKGLISQDLQLSKEARERIQHALE